MAAWQRSENCNLHSLLLPLLKFSYWTPTLPGNVVPGTCNFHDSWEDQVERTVLLHKHIFHEHFIISEDYVKSTWIWRVLVSIWGKKRRRSFSVYLGSSAEFISMIFGSFGKFWIGLCVQKKFSQKIFHRKKISKTFSKIFWSTTHQFL